MIIVGDVHGKIKDFYDLVLVPNDKHEEIIQVGDMGVGFGQGDHWHDNFDAMMLKYNAKFIRGNHDNPGKCKMLKSWISDGKVVNDTMFIGGAWSIDRAWRTEDVNWWADEELTSKDLYMLYDVYDLVRPRIMITHDFPHEVSKIMFKEATLHKPIMETRTSQALQSMFELHQPELWIGGHWHYSKNEIIEGTNFICLNELETMRIEI